MPRARSEKEQAKFDAKAKAAKALLAGNPMGKKDIKRALRLANNYVFLLVMHAAKAKPSGPGPGATWVCRRS